MSTQIQVLVATRHIEYVLDQIEAKEGFEADLNVGYRMPEQFVFLMIDLDDWIVTNIAKDLNQTHQGYGCYVSYRNKLNTPQLTERRLDLSL